jgi:CDP-diacylglycerol--glycerol-3-phosphate 3-phosphatidyltransferase
MRSAGDKDRVERAGGFGQAGRATPAASAVRAPIRGWRGGLYAAKPAFRRRLAAAADWLAARGVHPDAVTAGGVAAAFGGALALAASGTDARLALLVPAAAGARITLNALDGMVAERRGLARPWGKVLNELADRVADLALLGALVLVPGASAGLVAAAVVAALLSSHVGVLAEAAGGRRLYGGPMGKADRMLWLALAAAATAVTGDHAPLRVLPVVLLVGGLATLATRLGEASGDL